MKKFDFDLKDKKRMYIAGRIINNILWNESNISHIHVETEDDSKQWKKVIINFE